MLLCCAGVGRAFDLQLTLNNPTALTDPQREILLDAMAEAEAFWERHIVGYQPGITLTTLPITITGTTSGFGAATVQGTTVQGGFRLSTRGSITINRNELEEYSNYGAEGLNIIDDLMAHEIGHVLGIGTHWVANGLYTYGSGQYTGEYGLAAYRAEFDPGALFVPVELAGSAGTPNAHWDQVMRSSQTEGNPADPFSLSPLLGITDSLGRDLALELMTGALDPDYGEPFLSNTTLQSLRDLGFVVVPEPPAALLAMAAAALWGAYIRRRRCATFNRT